MDTACAMCVVLLSLCTGQLSQGSAVQQTRPLEITMHVGLVVGQKEGPLKALRGKSETVLTFRELVTLARFGLTVLLTFNHTVVTSEKTVRFECVVMLAVVFVESTSHAEHDRSGLTADATAAYRHFEIPFAFVLSDNERLENRDLVREHWEEFDKWTIVDQNHSFAGFHVNTGGGGFATADCVDLLHQQLERNGFGLLSFMRMGGADIHTKVAKHLTAEGTFRKHTFHREGNRAGRMLGEEALRSLEFHATRIAGVTEVLFVGHFFTGQGDLLRIDDDHIIASVHVRGEDGLGLTAKNRSDFGREATQCLAFGIHKDPLFSDVFWFSRVCFETDRIHR